MLYRMNRDVFLTETLVNNGVTDAMLPYWKHIVQFFAIHQDEYGDRNDNRVCLLLDTGANTLYITCDLLGDGHYLKLLHCDTLAKFSVIAPIIGWWIIESQKIGTLDYKLLPAEARALILEAL